MPTTFARDMAIKIFSTPMVGKSKNGTTEKSRKGASRFGLFNKKEISDEPKYMKQDNKIPNISNKILIRLTRFLASFLEILGIKYKYAAGNPAVKTITKVL